MNSQQKTVNLLSICRKAGRLIIGFDAVKNAVTEGDVSCVLVSEDISHKTLKEIKYFCGNSNTAVTDFGFGKRFSELGTLIQGRTKRTSKKDNDEP